MSEDDSGSMIMEPAIILFLLAMVLVTAVVTDLRSSRIPNWLTFPAMGIAILMQAWIGGQTGVLSSLAGLGAGMGLFFLLMSVRRSEQAM